MVILLLCTILFFSSCSRNYHGDGMISIELNFPSDQSPLEGAENITLSVWSQNEQIASKDFPINSKVGTIEEIPQNIPLRAIVEAKNIDGATISRGRTPEFTLEKNKEKQVKIFFSRVGSFSRPKNEMSPREDFKVAFLSDNSLLVAGGKDLYGNYINYSEIYSHEELKFSTGAALNNGRTGHSMAQLQNGDIGVFGGENNSGPIAEIEVYNLKENTFTIAANLNTPRKNATVTVMDTERALVCGGIGKTSGLNTCEVFNPITSSVNLLELKMNNFRYNHSALLLLDGNILFVGGKGFKSLEIFNTVNGAFLLPSLLSSERENSYIDYADSERVIVACGTRSAGIDFIKLTDISVFSPVDSPLLPAFCSAHLMLDGRLFVAGGIENDKPTDNAFIINTNNNRIEWVGKMLSKRVSPVIEMLEDGTLLILAGTDTPPYAEIFNPP